MKVKCEYRRCGGKGNRETGEKARRIAQERMVVDGELLQVCESCADMLLRGRRQSGKSVSRVRAGQTKSAFDHLPDYLKPEGNWTEEDV